VTIKCGDAVGDYKVMNFAGAGGMGAVYEIEHAITKRVEAMKVLPTGVGSSPEDVQRFEREIEVQARLHHPNIVALYNAVRDDHSIALIMEYVEGESLERMLKNGNLPLDMAVDYAGQVLDALAYAHNKGVIHRDVKPANIIITPSGTAKLMDFGLALAVNDLRLTHSGVAVGSAWYMSPEQVRAADQLDARTDIYSMGAVLHEMLTGRKLFDADGSFAVMRAQIEAIPRAPSALNPEVPAALDEVVARALAKDPAARFQTANEFRILLEAWVAGMRSSDVAPEIKRAHKAAGRHSAGAARSKPSLRSDQLLPSGAAVPLVLVVAALVAVVGSVGLWPKGTRVAKGVRVPSEAVPMPARMMAPFAADLAPSEGRVALQGPEVPTNVVTPAACSAAPSTASTRQAGKAASPVRRTVIAAEPLSRTTVLKPSPRVLERASESGLAAAPGVTAASEASAEPEARTQTDHEVRPSRSSNRFIRVLSKLNPFHRGGTNDSVEPANAPPPESIAK
jgi:serine/threonine-protein kinase